MCSKSTHVRTCVRACTPVSVHHLPAMQRVSQLLGKNSTPSNFAKPPSARRTWIPGLCHRTAPHRTAPHRTAPHRTALHRTQHSSRRARTHVRTHAHAHADRCSTHTSAATCAGTQVRIHIARGRNHSRTQAHTHLCTASLSCGTSSDSPVDKDTTSSSVATICPARNNNNATNKNKSWRRQEEREIAQTADTRACTHARTDARTSAHAHARTRTHTHAHARTRTHTHAHARTHAHTRTRTHACTASEIGTRTGIRGSRGLDAEKGHAQDDAPCSMTRSTMNTSE